MGEKKRKRETEATDQRGLQNERGRIIGGDKESKERLENIDSRLHRLETLVSTNMASSVNRR